MRRILLAAAIIQSVTLMRPLLGTIAYLTTRATRDQQRQAVANVISQRVAG